MNKNILPEQDLLRRMTKEVTDLKIKEEIRDNMKKEVVQASEPVLSNMLMIRDEISKLRCNLDGVLKLKETLMEFDVDTDIDTDCKPVIFSTFKGECLQIIRGRIELLRGLIDFERKLEKQGGEELGGSGIVYE
jgi:hypothetical protein